MHATTDGARQGVRAPCPIAKTVYRLYTPSTAKGLTVAGVFARQGALQEGAASVEMSWATRGERQAHAAARKFTH